MIDNALSPTLADDLRKAGHEAVHVRDLGLQAATDAVLFDRAAAEQRAIVSADTDFGTLFALRSERFPSAVLFRGAVARRPGQQARLLLKHLPVVESDLDAGSIVVFDGARIADRRWVEVPPVFVEALVDEYFQRLCEMRNLYLSRRRVLIRERREYMWNLYLCNAGGESLSFFKGGWLLSFGCSIQQPSQKAIASTMRLAALIVPLTLFLFRPAAARCPICGRSSS